MRNYNGRMSRKEEKIEKRGIIMNKLFKLLYEISP